MHELLIWYKANKRDLPWRNTHNPYKIWLSEIILQQTRVEQGRAYYHSFVKKFPTVQKLAMASEDEVLQLWQGLGYYSRARNLHHAAKYICNELNGEFPQSYNDLIKLKGVGDYTASAISSIAFGEAQAVVDGNVYRVLARYFAVDTPIDSGKGKTEFKKLAEEILDISHPGMHNEAMMELGSMVCKPKNPICSDCPLSNGCAANKNSRIFNYPVKTTKRKTRVRYLNFIVCKKSSSVYLQKRGGDDIWKGLYQFPLIETKAQLNPIKLLERVVSDFPYLEGVSSFAAPKEYKHILSHQVLHVRFIKLNGNLDLPKDEFTKVSIRELGGYGMPRVITRYLEDFPL